MVLKSLNQIPCPILLELNLIHIFGSSRLCWMTVIRSGTSGMIELDAACYLVGIRFLHHEVLAPCQCSKSEPLSRLLVLSTWSKRNFLALPTDLLCIACHDITQGKYGRRLYCDHVTKCSVSKCVIQVVYVLLCSNILSFHIATWLTHLETKHFVTWSQYRRRPYLPCVY